MGNYGLAIFKRDVRLSVISFEGGGFWEDEPISPFQITYLLVLSPVKTSSTGFQIGPAIVQDPVPKVGVDQVAQTTGARNEHDLGWRRR